MHPIRGWLVAVCLVATPLPLWGQNVYQGRFSNWRAIGSPRQSADISRASFSQEVSGLAPQDEDLAADDSVAPPIEAPVTPSFEPAEPIVPDTKTWWVIAPYAWVPGLHGQISSFGRTLAVDIDTGTVLSNLDQANGAIQLHLEAGRGPFGIILDTNIIHFSTTLTVPQGQVGLNLQQSLIEFLGTMRVFEAKVDSTNWTLRRDYSIDLLGGGRYYNFFQSITVIFQ